LARFGARKGATSEQAQIPGDAQQWFGFGWLISARLT